MGKFDLIVSSSTLEHIARPLSHVKAILRVSQPKWNRLFLWYA